MLWTSIENSRHARRVVGQAERGEPAAKGKWALASAGLQISQLFRAVPDFILTFEAGYAAICSDAQWCALVEHELSHCGVERDMYGTPKFRKSTGLPAFTLVGHDVEEFVGVVHRYRAAAAGVQAMIDAAAEGPTIAEADIDFACGNCQG
ncbi:putative metallopeptidase [Bradyrhizobium sp. ARR65]|uniref:putative metallopeptidase n=1 Tax=Bradyrhizobium sp. ARR65 TaxID=1040989 RepID=UPI000A4A76B6|nr:putative metallopeptidase [Bradyrhizobium sp. ARR65]